MTNSERVHKSAGLFMYSKSRIAQLVERQTVNLQVSGSSPLVGDCFLLFFKAKKNESLVYRT